VYAGAPGLSNWPLQLLWPFSTTGWGWPIVPWGDLGVTGIFVAEMFAWYRWRGYGQLIAAATLIVVLGYVAARWFVKGGG
jgi:hypothetical protein